MIHPISGRGVKANGENTDEGRNKIRDYTRKIEMLVKRGAERDGGKTPVYPP